MKPLLSILFVHNRTDELESIAISIQKGNIELLNHTLENYKPFIKKTASSVCKRYIDDMDDEYSIGLIAFHDALYHYDKERGSSLLALAEVMIKRKVIDYIRQQAKHQHISMEKRLLDSVEIDNFSLENTISITAFEQHKESEARKEEIRYFQQSLAKYGLDFEELVKQSPKHEDARINAMKVAKVVFEDEHLLAYFLQKKRLPLKELENKVNVSRKTLERNRKYIIAMIIILHEDFIMLQEYFKGRLG
ncbi:RNA polymerase sigma-I factor [Bacillus sp. FSL K6-3431]|uniref:RNA polymerase sigma-I factor n=1 Tax=Bacillus sp. FSL K6-3431 TaxID=2921500 RepID=UPI0030FC57C5